MFQFCLVLAGYKNRYDVCIEKLGESIPVHVLRLSYNFETPWHLLRNSALQKTLGKADVGAVNDDGFCVEIYHETSVNILGTLSSLAASISATMDELILTSGNQVCYVRYYWNIL